MMRKKGFTLVELLFVIAIIGIILSLLAPALVMVKRRARAIQCVSRLHQIAVAIESYLASNGSIIPYVNTGPEAQAHPHHWFQPSTGIPSLRYFLQHAVGTSGEEARCPADTGCAGQSYYPTQPGKSCFEDWGQSMLYNSSCYRDPEAPGYIKDFSGPLYGAKPVRKPTVTRPADFFLAGDFWAHWHFGASSSASLRPYYTNLLFFDGHVEGRRYATQKEGLAYLDWDGLRRWWIPNPPPFKPPE